MDRKNFMNANDVYPIIDMISRKMKQGSGVNTHYGGDGHGGGQVHFDTSNWEVESFEVTRDVSNPIDPNVIIEVLIVYRNGAVQNLELVRGLQPPVPDTVDDSEYINNLMIVGVNISTLFDGETSLIAAKIFRENGYGNFVKVELDYGD